MTGTDDTDRVAGRRRHVSRRGLLGLGLGVAVAGCLRVGSDTEGTPTATTAGETPSNPERTAGPESDPGLQSTPTGLTEAWSRDSDAAALRAVPDNRSVFVGARYGVRRIDASGGTVRWDQETEMIKTRPAVTDSTVYASGRDGTVYALARDGGRVRWTFEADTGLTTVPIALPEQDRIVVGAGESDGYTVGSVDGESEYDPTYVYGLDTEGNEIWTVETANGNPVTGTAVHDGVVYVRTANRIDTYDLDDGTEREASVGVHDVQWDDRSQSTFSTTRVAADESGVYLLTQDFVASVTHDGTHRWTFEPFDSSLRLQYEPGTVYISAEDNALYAVDAADGSREWRVQVDGEPLGITLADGYLWSTDASNTVTAIETDSGEVLFSESFDDVQTDLYAADIAVAGQQLVYATPSTLQGFEIQTDSS